MRTTKNQHRLATLQIYTEHHHSVDNDTFPNTDAE